VSISNELLQDSAYDIVGDITEQFAYAMAQEVDNQVLNGTGSPCSGVLTAAAGYSVVLATGNTNFSSVTAADYSLMLQKLSTIDASNSTYVLGKLAAHYVRTLKDSQNMPIFQAIAGPNLDTLYGQPFTVANKITDTTGVSTAFAVLGDFKQFYMINRLGNLELLVDPYGDATSYNTRFIWATRKGLGIRRSSAFVRILTAAS
jgi:HK97 family phage major capsid protein